MALKVGTKSWGILQDPLLLKIFRELTVKDLLACSEVCFDWNRVSQDELLWRYLFERDFLYQKYRNNVHKNARFAQPLEPSWKEEYERLTDRVPRVKRQILKGHSDEVVHIAFSNDGLEFVSCSKDQSFIAWKKEEGSSPKFIFHCKKDMANYDWLQTYSAQYSPLDTKLLISGVSSETGGEIAIFMRELGSYNLVHRVRNQPFDLMGCWCSDSSFITGSIVWNPNADSFIASIWLCTTSIKPLTKKICRPNRITYDPFIPLIDPIAYDIDSEDSADEDDSDGLQKEEMLRYITLEGTNSPHFVQCFSNKNQTEQPIQSNSNDSLPLNDNSASDILSDNGSIFDTSVTETEQYRQTAIEESYLVFVCGDKTYVGHQIGFQKMPMTSMEKTTRPFKILEMNGQIVGMRMSPENNYLYVNVRPWEPDASPDLFHAPKISQHIEGRKINIKTMEIEEGKESIFVGHQGFTATDGAFYLYIDASKNFLASGSEDSFGYIWEAHYGVLLEKLCGHAKCVNCVVFDPTDEEVCITGSDDHTLQVFISNRKDRNMSNKNNS